MKKGFGILVLVCICLILPGTVSALEVTPMEAEQEFDIPEMADEMEALTGGDYEPEKEYEKQQIDQFYRLLGKDAALSSYGMEKTDAVYDPREIGKVTPVRSQIFNTCWAFSSLAAGEQSLVYKGLADPGQLDLSEAHLLYFFYHSVPDPLGNTAGDGNSNISDLDFLSVGSNTIFSTFALAGWLGAAGEETAPFEELTEETVYEPSKAYADTAHLQNAYWINFKDVDAVNVIKQMILKYGAAAINFYWNNRYYNGGRDAYYFPLNSSQANNHSVTIVGWDDTFSKENFNEENRPKNDGAWIVKNSYGASWGDNGYFYLSYEDGAVNSGNTSANRARAYIFDFEPADNYRYNYQYDGSAGAYNATNPDSSLTKVESGGSVANVFTVHNKDGFGTENLKAVSFALFDTAVSYSIQIYKNLTDTANPFSGTAQLSEPVTGSTSYAGYYTIPLVTPVELKEGETFSVAVTFQKESGEDIEFFVDKTYQNGSWISFTNETRPGESFRFIDGQWEDMAANGITARMKAFTDAGELAKTDTDETYILGTNTGQNRTEQKEEEKLQEQKLEPNGMSDSAPDSMTQSAPNGMSDSAPTKSAQTSDTSGRRMIFWLAVLICGVYLLRKGKFS